MRGVDNDCECKHEYRPDKAGQGISKHVKRNGWQFATITILCWLSVYVNLVYLYPHVDDGLRRWLLEGHVHAVFGMTVLTGAFLFLQIITNGNLVGRAMQHGISAGIVVAAWLIVLGIIIIGV